MVIGAFIFLLFFAPLSASASVYGDSTGKTIIEGSPVEIPDGNLVISTGNITITAGNLTAGTIVGDGSSLTNLSSANTSGGTLPVAQGGTGVTSSTGTAGGVVLSNAPTLSGTINGGTFSGAHTGDGSALTGISDASGLSDGGTLIELVTTADDVAIGTDSANGKLVVQDTDDIFSLIGTTATGLTASTESTDVDLDLARTMTFSTGAISTQRAMRIQPPTYAFTAGSIIGLAGTLEIDGPVAGTNATITNNRILNIEENNTSTIPTVKIDQAGAGNAAMEFIAGSGTYVMGNDNADADKFKISLGSFGGANDKFTVLSSDNVGINTNSPTGVIDIAGDTTGPILTLDGTTSDSAILFYNSAQQITIGVDDTDDKFKISDSTTLGTNNRIVIDTSGNIGIGVDSPTQKVQVNGNMNIDSGNITVDQNASDASTYFVGVSSGNAILFDNNSEVNDGMVHNSTAQLQYNIDSDNNEGSNSDKFVWGHNRTTDTGGAELMRLTAAGNLGIGTNNPTEVLHVVGQIRMVDGLEADNRVMGSDSAGVGAWSSPGNGVPGTLACSGTGTSTTYNGHCYKMFAGHSFNWPNAAAFCATWGGYLTKIESSGENSAINGITTASAWIGAHDLPFEGMWRWLVDHSDAWITADYSNWSASEPNDSSGFGSAECAYMVNGTGVWDDYDCGTGLQFVCERDN